MTCVETNVARYGTNERKIMSSRRERYKIMRGYKKFCVNETL